MPPSSGRPARGGRGVNATGAVAGVLPRLAPTARQRWTPRSAFAAEPLAARLPVVPRPLPGAAYGFSLVPLQDRVGEPAHQWYDLFRTACRAGKVVKRLKTGQGVEDVDHLLARVRGWPVVL